MSSPANALLSFWFKPAASTRALIEADAGHTVALVIAAAFGAVQSGMVYLRAESPTPLIFVWGALAGVGLLYLMGVVFRISGKLLKGDPKSFSVRVAFGLSLLPWTLLFGFVLYFNLSGGDPNVLAQWFVLLFVPFIYGYTVLLLSLSVALGLSLWKTFFCIAVTFIGTLFPLTLIAQLIMGAPTA